MKKKLLITLGCSLTEGVGCYDYSKMSKMAQYGDLNYEETEYQKSRFHEFGWPNRLGKKLGYDKVLNLGLGGSGQSAHVKLFFEKIIPKDLSDYEVLVVWLLSEPSRFSFYSGGEISLFQPSYSGDFHEFSGSYLREILYIDKDSILETIFYIKVIEQACENNNFNLQITSWDTYSLGRIFKMYPSKYEMKDVYRTSFKEIYENRDEYCSLVCKHPNEKGYELLANSMFESIKKFKPELINKNEVSNFEWEWIGEPKKWITTI